MSNFATVTETAPVNTSTKRGRKAVWPGIVAEAKDNAGKWCKINRTFTSGSASATATRLRKGFPGLNVRVERTDDGAALWIMAPADVKIEEAQQVVKAKVKAEAPKVKRASNGKFASKAS